MTLNLFNHETEHSTGPLFRGRPSKFGEIWRPEKMEEVLQLFSQGASLDEVVACLGISRTTFYNWINSSDKQQFTEIMRIGVQLAKAWWDCQGRDGLTQGPFNARLWEVNMRNRYGWMGRDQAEEALPGKARELSEVESVRQTVDVAAIIQAAESKGASSARK